jgi:hypothetical protein
MTKALVTATWLLGLLVVTTTTAVAHHSATMFDDPMKNGQPAAIWVDATRADGKKFNPRAGFAIK